MAETIPSATPALLTQRISNLLDWAETRDGKWTAWVTGTPTGGPSGDGRYPLPYDEDEDVLIECPALLADMVSGPAAAAEAAVAAAEAARDAAIAASTGVVAEREAAQAAMNAAIAARDLALSYRDQSGTHAANANADRQAAEQARADAQEILATIQTTVEQVQGVGEQAAQVAAHAAQVASDKAEVDADRIAAQQAAADAQAALAGIQDVAEDAAQVATDRVAVEAVLTDVTARQADVADKAAQVAADVDTVAADKALVAADRAAAEQAKIDAQAAAASVDGPALQAQIDTLDGRVDAHDTQLVELASSASDPKTIMRIMLAIAELKANQWGTPNGLTDDFVDQDGVDAAASVGEVYDSTGKLFKNTPAVPGDASVQNATSGDSTVSASSAYPGYGAYMAFDGSYVTDSGGNAWFSNDGNLGHWIKRDFTVQKAWTRYYIAVLGPSLAPAAWNLQGSNDNSTWTTVDSRSDQTGWAAGSAGEREFTIANPGAYRYYRLVITAKAGAGGSGGVYSVQELRFSTEPTPAGALDLRSVAYTALASPTKASALVIAKASAAFTLNSDLAAYVSRDNGATWTKLTLTAREAISGFTVYEALNTDLSAQPSGTAMRWRVVGASGWSWEVGAVAFLWN